MYLYVCRKKITEIIIKPHLNCKKIKENLKINTCPYTEFTNITINNNINGHCICIHIYQGWNC